MVASEKPMEEATVDYSLSSKEKGPDLATAVLEVEICRCQMNMLFILAQKAKAWVCLLLLQQGQGWVWYVLWKRLLPNAGTAGRRNLLAPGG